MVSRFARSIAAAALIAAALPAAPARADDSAAADALFQQAKSLTEQQRWADACPKFEASYKLDRTLGTLLNLADCEEHVGRTATAWAHWGEAVEMAEKAGDKRADFAAKRRAALKDKLPMVRLDVSAGKSTLTVQRDGVRIDAAAYGVPLPSDPGKHTIAVRRGEETLAEKTVTVKEGETVAVAFDLEAIERAAPPPSPPAAPVSGAQRKVGWGLLGAGLGVVAIAGGLEIGAIRSKADANAPGACKQHLCTPEGLDAVNRARTLANAGQWVGIGGILMTAVGVTLVVTAPSSGPARKATAIGVTPWIAPGLGGLAIGGAL